MNSKLQTDTFYLKALKIEFKFVLQEGLYAKTCQNVQILINKKVNKPF